MARSPDFISKAFCLFHHGITIKIMLNFLENLRIFVKKDEFFMQDIAEDCIHLNREQSW